MRAKSGRKQVLQKSTMDQMKLAYAPCLRAIKSNGKLCAAIISHLHERGFSMNNSIDLLFRWRISLGMYRIFFSFAATRVKAGAALLLARDHDPLSTIHFTFRGCPEWCFARVIFITLPYALQMCTLHCYIAARWPDQLQCTITTALSL